MNYGKYRFRYYFLNEDHPTPLPENPIITIQEFTETIEKANQNAELLKAQARLKSANLKGWATLAMILIGGAILAMILWPESTPEVARTVVANVSNNITPINPTVIG